MSDGVFEPVLAAAMAHAREYLAPENDGPVAPVVGLAEMRARMDVDLSVAGMDPVAVLDELVEAARGGNSASGRGRFYGWVIGGALPAALAADWMTSVWDQNAGLFAISPAAAVAEEVAGKWLKELLNVPKEASFAFVTGCQMAHVTCLAAARYALLAARGWDVNTEGLAGAPALRVLTSTEMHGTTGRAVRVLGMGERHIQKLAVDSEGRLRAEALRDALAREPERPTIVVLQAGDLNIGAFDDFEALVPLAKEYGAWVHVDGAFGLWAAASERYRHLMRGSELADSWATDGHKWLNVPYDSGYAFVADAAAHRKAISQRGAYIPAAGEGRDQIDWTPEFSRRARGFATYAALRQLGRGGVADLVDRCCRHCEALVTRIGKLPGAEMLGQQINQGLVRFLHPAQGATQAQHDAFTDRMIAEIVATGEAVFSATTWRGRRAMRVSVSNWQTNTADVERVVQCVAAVLEREGRRA